MRSLPMHIVLWHRLLAFLLISLATVAAKPGFLLTTHSKLIPGSKHNVCITFTGVTSEIYVEYEFKRPKDSSYDNTYAAGHAQWSAAGGCKEFALPVTLPTGFLELVVSGYSTGNELNRYEFNGSTLLTVFNSVPDFTLIQTDKPVYKPGQTVRIRLVTLMFNLSVVTTGGLNVSIKNPDGIDIERWESISRSKGIVELSLKLADEPRLGTYEILCDASGRIERKNFTVLQYVLPRVEVLHKPAKFFVRGSKELIGEICARYTFSGDKNLPGLKGLLTARFTVVRVENESSVTEQLHQSFTLTDEINGCYVYNISAQSLNIDWIEAANNNFSILVAVNVIEHGTGIRTTASDALIKLEIDNAVLEIIGDDTYKPGLPYSFKVKLVFRNSQSLSDKSITASVVDGYSRKHLPTERTDDDGFAFFTPTLVSLFQEIIIEAMYKDNISRASARDRKKVTSWYSPSGRYIKIRQPNDGNALGCNREETIDFDYTTTSEGEVVSLSWQVTGKTNIVQSKTEDINFAPSASISPPSVQLLAESCTMDANISITTRSSRGSASISVNTAPEMYPTAKLIVFYIAPDGEIVADWTVIRIKECSRNPVRMSFSKFIVRPGKKINLDISAAANSFCTYGVIDRSIDLMSTGKLLDLAEVVETAQGRLPVNNNWQSKLSDYMKFNVQCELRTSTKNRNNLNLINVNDSKIAFLMGNMAVATDVQVDTRKCFCSYKGVSLLGQPMHHPSDSENELGSDGRTYEPSVLIRDYFPETWLWDSVNISRSGKASVAVKSPHSMTSWRGKAMCVHSDLGFGISPVALLTTFQRFFIRVRLPYSVIRGESVPVVVKIHNYYPECFTISVRMENSSQFESSKEDTARCICGAYPELLIFRLVPRSLGYINVTITAEDVTLASNTTVCPQNANMSKITGIRDTVVESLLVEPEGKREERVQSAYICGRSGEQPKKLTMSLTLPNGIVADSARGSVSVVGDLLAVTLSNMRDLIVLPQGCGEQSMGAFAPITFAARYLEVTRQLTPSLADDVRRFLNEGYQRQLWAMYYDGAFGYYFQSGRSLWLTAFIVKCFTHASRYLTVARDNIGLSMRYIRQNQPTDGCFSPKEAGVYNKFAPALDGPSGQKLKIRVTAFVVIAMLEAGVPSNDSNVLQAINCLDRPNETDVYGLAMTAYAFSLHDLQSQRRTNAMKELLRNAIQEGSGLLGTTDTTKYWRGDISQDLNAPINIETTAYALMAILKEPGQTANALPVVNWLMRRQNSRGAYASTQDTVVSIQALAAYAEATYLTHVNTGVGVHVSTFEFSRRFEVTTRNRLVVQSAELSNLRPGNLTFSINGGGCVVVQAKAIYNVMIESLPKTYFQTSVNPYAKEETKKSDNCTQRTIQICTKYTGEHDNSSGMAIIDVKMISGWIPDIASLDALVANTTLQLMLYELNDKLISLHFKEITREYRCLTFEAIRIHGVHMTQPGQVFTYEYYAPGNRHETTFTLDECLEVKAPNISKTTLLECNDEREECHTQDEDICPRCLQPILLTTLCQSKHVLKVRLRPGNLNTEAITILEDLKNSSSNLKDRPATLTIPKSCLCETLEIEDTSNPFIIAFTNNIAIGRQRPAVIQLSDEDNYVFTATRNTEQEIKNVLRRCSPVSDYYP